MSYLNRLKKMEAKFRDAKAPDRARGLPVGDHVTKLTGATLKEGTTEKTKGNLIVVFSFTVIAGEAKGQKGTKSINLDWTDEEGNQPGLGLLKGDLETLGVKLSKLENLPNALKKCVGLIVQVRSVEKNGYFNLYINQIVDTPEDGDDLTSDEEIEEATLDDADAEDEAAEEPDDDEDADSDDDSDDESEEEEEEEEKTAPKVSKKKTAKKAGKKAGKKKPVKKEEEEESDDEDESFDDFMEDDDESDDE